MENEILRNGSVRDLAGLIACMVFAVYDMTRTILVAALKEEGLSVGVITFVGLATATPFSGGRSCIHCSLSVGALFYLNVLVVVQKIEETCRSKSIYYLIFTKK